MKIAYFDCSAGAAGDMIVASMLDAGLDAEFLKSQIATLGIENLDISIEKGIRGGLSAVRFEPLLPKQHHHRNIKDITAIIEQSGISNTSKATAIRIFDNLAKAEAAVHGKDIDEVHFHEVGALDSIVDIVAAAVGIEALGIEKAYCSPLRVGGGTVTCEHGTLPVPAPATLELLKGIPFSGGPIDAELVTPTGAAVLTTIAEEFWAMPAMKGISVGYGAGTMDPKAFPNVLRLVIGETADEDSVEMDCVCLLETNIDDATGEVVGFIMGQLMDAGALDVFSRPIFMKQSRPGVILTVICKVDDAKRLERLIFESGVTLGIRRQVLDRTKLRRDFVSVKTEFGEIDVKRGWLGDRVVNAKPEFKQCAAAAEKYGVAVKAVMDAVMIAFNGLEKK
jgi:uncharacterized protein (TIGR00299 family) protein